MKTVLLTGATGFLGSHILESLLNENYNAVILKRSTSNTWRIDHLLDKVKSYDVDRNQLQKSFEEQQIHVVIHTACNYGRNEASLAKIAHSNLIFGLKILDASMKYQVETFFNTDTFLEKNLNAYSLSKKQFVEWLQQKSNLIKIVNFKLEHMYGPKDDSTKLASSLLSQLEEGVLDINLTSGRQMRDFIYIDDVVSAYMMALTKLDVLSKFAELEVGTGISITVKSFILKLKNSFEDQFGITESTLNFGSIPYRQGESMNVEVDNSTLLGLGWTPKVKLEDGFDELIKSRITQTKQPRK